MTGVYRSSLIHLLVSGLNEMFLLRVCNMGTVIDVECLLAKGVDVSTLLEVDGPFLECLIPDINLRWKFVRQRQRRASSTFISSSPSTSRAGSSLSVSSSETPLDESPDGSFLDDSTSLSFISVENIPSSRKRPSDSASVSSAGETSSKRQLVDVESFLSKVTSVSLTISAVKDIQLEVLLRASVCGRWILRSYEDDGYLSDEARSDLVDLLVAELLNITTSPTQEEYKILVQKVLELFPTETDEVYYAPPQRSGSHQKLARGKLFDKFRAKKARYGLTSDRSKKKSDPSQSTVEWVLSETEAKSVDFLSKWQEPIEDVNKHWVSAAPHRLQWLKNQDNCEKVADYLSQWPHLKHPENGPKLINIDFELSTLGKEKGDLLLLNWDNFIKSLQVIVSKKKNQQQTRLSWKGNYFETEVLLLELLPSLIAGNRFVSLGNSEKHKPSVVEVRLAFIVRVNSAGDLNNQIRKLKDRMSKAGGQLQPFIAVVGERPNFTSLYVCLDSHLYKVKSIKEAVDLCFKTFYALNCNYPPESEHIWQFFQRYFYKITLTKQVNITAVTTFCTSLQAVTRSQH
ncbi:Cyclin-A1 [Frankliniella fusca]|uniref:Cyclin-A1 n=1 Tax=Frankliniella fusca TaxID=407009 RepID=A0AAE1HGH8_9NEOP|nr:Cyclin-A1 [Frankliniella fusca]